MKEPLKILAIQFKSLGDAVLMIPALEAIRKQYPDCALHALVQEETAPVLRPLPWLTRVWPMPRARGVGRARLRLTWPVIRALRREHFNRSVDFSGNDRSAILSLMCGARERLGPINARGFLGRRLCYNQRVPPAPLDRHESLRPFRLLSAWGIRPPRSIELLMKTDPAADAAATGILPAGTVVCHIGAGIPKKEWPVSHWAELYRMATAAGFRLAFTTGRTAREAALVSKLKQLAPEAPVLPGPLDLAVFLALLKRAEAVITCDTGPMHFAGALDVPLVALFGPTSFVQWGPVGRRHRLLVAPVCPCDTTWHDCRSASHCLASITPARVLDQLQLVLEERQTTCSRLHNEKESPSVVTL